MMTNLRKYLHPQNSGARAVLLAAGQLLARLISVLWIAYLARRIGPYDFGWYSVVMSYTTLISATAATGVSVTISRNLVQRPQESSALLGALFWIRLLGGIGLWMLVLLALPRLGYPSFLTWVFVLAGLFIVITTGQQVAEAVYIAREKTSHLWITQILTAGLWAVFGAFSLVSQKGLIWLFMALACSVLVVCPIHLILIHRLGSWPDFRWNSSTLKQTLLEGLPLGVAFLLAAATERADRILLSLYCEPAHIGAYGLAVMILYSLVESLWHPFTTVLFPMLAQAASDHDRQRLRWILRKATVWSTMFGILVAGVLWTLAPVVILKLWGSRYQDTVGLLSGLLIGLPLLAMNRVYASVFITHHRQRGLMYLNAAGLAITLIGGIWLFPHFGTGGAVGVLVSVQGMQWLAFTLFFRTFIPGFFPLKSTLITLAAGMTLIPLSFVSEGIRYLPLSVGVFGFTVWWGSFEQEDRDLCHRWIRGLVVHDRMKT